MTLTACGGGSAPPAPQPASNPDLLGVLETRPNLKHFTEALQSTGIADRLLASGSYTLFVPMDRAVHGTLDAATIRHHILQERLTFSDMAGESTSYETLNNDEIEIDVTEKIAVGTALMVESDIQASNGVIHVIDKVQVLPAPGSSEESSLDQPQAVDPAISAN
ncbi:MAG: fasciclin domain-containing protein [Alphaproteobacteria bacterium]